MPDHKTATAPPIAVPPILRRPGFGRRVMTGGLTLDMPPLTLAGQTPALPTGGDFATLPVFGAGGRDPSHLLGDFELTPPPGMIPPAGTFQLSPPPGVVPPPGTFQPTLPPPLGLRPGPTPGTSLPPDWWKDPKRTAPKSLSDQATEKLPGAIRSRLVLGPDPELPGAPPPAPPQPSGIKGEHMFSLPKLSF